MKIATQKSSVMKSIYSLCLLLFMAGAAVAQTVPAQDQQPQAQPMEDQQPVKADFSETELEKFVDVYVQVAEIQQENETVMMQAIEAENLDINRFNEILQAQQQQATGEQPATGEVNATAEEMAAFNNAAQKIMTVQKEAQTEMQQVIDQDLGMETYEQIVIAYQQNPEVQQKVNMLLEEKMPREEN